MGVLSWGIGVEEGEELTVQLTHSYAAVSFKPASHFLAAALLPLLHLTPVTTSPGWFSTCFWESFPTHPAFIE